MWISSLVRHLIAYRRGVRVRKGDRLRAVVDIDANGIIYYRAPFSSGFSCRIPRGGVLRVYGEPTAWGLGFVCTADDPALESAIVPSSDRLHHAYAGCAFAFGIGEIGRRLEIVEGSAGRDRQPGD